MRKSRKWLTPEQAGKIGLELKESAKGRNSAQYYITKDQWEFVRLRKPSKPSKIDPGLLAWSDDGKIMPIEQFCKFHGLSMDEISDWRLCTHLKQPTYNITWKTGREIKKDNFDLLSSLRKEFESLPKFTSKITKIGGKSGVITLTDFHFGAYISRMLRTPDFNISILCNMLEEAADEVNRFGYKVVHVHLLGDLIESFTGLNHKNSWKGLDKGMFGVKAIRLFVELFIKHFLSKVNNLGKIKIVAGNHDRTTSNKDEDVDGGGADLISWGLELLGYDVEFSTSVITHEVDGICYILNHGHHPYTKKKSTEEMCWEYGTKGLFNFIMEGHLHSRIMKLQAKQVKSFQMISDDTIDCRRQVCCSLFTGNSYSEYGGWSTTPGFTISEENNSGKGVNVFDFSVN